VAPIAPTAEVVRGASGWLCHAQLRETAEWHIAHNSRPIGHEDYPEAVLHLLDEVSELRAALKASASRHPDGCSACGALYDHFPDCSDGDHFGDTR
jgi:hypothetical protein